MTNPKNTVGNFRKISNDVRRNLDKSLDSIVADANKRFDSDVNRIDERRRTSLDAIEDTKQELEDAKKELEKEKRQAIVGAAVGVGSIFADTIVPGSGQVLRTGYSAYQSRT
jgi:transposase